MAYKHGVYTNEVPTSVVPAVNTTAGLPVVFGTAPVHLASERAQTNKPILCYSYAEAVQQLGYSKDWAKYTLCEVMYSQFALYNRGPVVFVNVLNPKTHKKSTSSKNVTVTNKVAKVDAPVLLDTLQIKASAAGSALIAGSDYEAAYDDDGVLVITLLDDGTATAASNLTLTYDEIDAAAVDADDIIGGINVSDGSVKGLECLNKVFPITGLVPGIVLAPGWSENPTVAAVMKAKAGNINSHFKAITLNDVPTDSVKSIPTSKTG